MYFKYIYLLPSSMIMLGSDINSTPIEVRFLSPPEIPLTMELESIIIPAAFRLTKTFS